MLERVYILPEVRRKMDAYIAACDYEISGLGMVRKEGDVFVIHDIFLLEQDGSAGRTILDNNGLASLLTELVMAGKDISEVKWWWHSHVDGGCFWSGTDDACVDGFKPDGWFISTVGNKKGETKTRFDIYGEPVRCCVDNLDLVTLKSEEEEAYDALIKAEVDDKVRPIIVTPTMFPRTHPNRPTTGYPRSSGPYSDDFDLEDYEQFAEGMGMDLNTLLIQEGKGVCEGRIVNVSGVH